MPPVDGGSVQRGVERVVVGEGSNGARERSSFGGSQHGTLGSRPNGGTLLSDAELEDGIQSRRVNAILIVVSNQPVGAHGKGLAEVVLLRHADGIRHRRPLQGGTVGEVHPVGGGGIADIERQRRSVGPILLTAVNDNVLVGRVDGLAGADGLQPVVQQDCDRPLSGVACGVVRPDADGVEVIGKLGLEIVLGKVIRAHVVPRITSADPGVPGKIPRARNNRPPALDGGGRVGDDVPELALLSGVAVLVVLVDGAGQQERAERAI
ncbi:MAG: hypothetical protein L0Z62_15765 [Gemmataceae bacterium]|nr:hypothetical protein [Gemmataceae bacterium]